MSKTVKLKPPKQLKPHFLCVTHKEWPKKLLAAPKMVPFSQLPAVKKDTITGAARKFFGPFYFVTTLRAKHKLIYLFVYVLYTFGLTVIQSKRPRQSTNIVQEILENLFSI